MLGILGEDILGKLTDPLFEKGCNDAGVVQLRLV
jgi:hypothetical protein